jgi:hypothetical protein
VAVIRGADRVNVEGLAELRREMRKTRDQFGTAGTDGLKDVNYKVAEFVINRAKTLAKMQGGLQALAADSMVPSRSGVAARINAGGKKAPFFGGAEFGAYQNRRRLQKNTGGRATVVRDNENINKVIKRVEAQTVAYDRRGAPTTVSRRERNRGATAVKVKGVVLGWNQFQPWRGNDRGAGYFLYPTIRANVSEIIEMYGDEMERLLADVFPD